MKERDTESNVELPVPPIAEATEEELANFGELVADDYLQFKNEFLEWLLLEGKDTYRYEGYSEQTVQTTHYKVEEAYRWIWNERGEYVKQISIEDATELIDYLARKTPHPDGYVYTFEKCLRRLLKFFREKRSVDIDEWEHEIPLNTNDDTTESKDRFYPEEMDALFRASIASNSVRSYHNKRMSPDERDKIKAHLAQRFEKPKSEIGPEDFKRANSWKIPSIIAMTADVGLRPIEIGRVKTSWIDVRNRQLVVPAEESVKSNESWECALSTKSINALKNWIEERETYEKYRDTDLLWLTKRYNPYSSGSLNRILQNLMEVAEINEQGRNLSWYSFRHGVASIWAEEEGIYHAKNQLRHSNIETTMRYTRGSPSKKSDIADSMW